MRAFLAAFDTGELDVKRLRAFDRPVYLALGGRSNPEYYTRMAERLAAQSVKYLTRAVDAWWTSRQRRPHGRRSTGSGEAPPTSVARTD